MQVPENPYTSLGAKKQKKRFNDLNINVHYRRSTDILAGFLSDPQSALQPKLHPLGMAQATSQRQQQEQLIATQLTEAERTHKIAYEIRSSSPLARSHLNESHRHIKHNYVDAPSPTLSKDATVDDFSPYSPQIIPIKYQPGQLSNFAQQAQSVTSLIAPRSSMSPNYGYQMQQRELCISSQVSDHQRLQQKTATRNQILMQQRNLFVKNLGSHSLEPYDSQKRQLKAPGLQLRSSSFQTLGNQVVFQNK